MKKVIIIFILILLFGILSNGCRPLEAEDSTISGGKIACNVFYRQTAGIGFVEAPEITFTGGTEQKEHRFENMGFQARFQDDQFEGRALSIAVTNLETGAEISRQLYQFDPQNPPENQFIGGHGFTGLHYVYHPGSEAEMQYFCSVR